MTSTIVVVVVIVVVIFMVEAGKPLPAGAAVLVTGVPPAMMLAHSSCTLQADNSIIHLNTDYLAECSSTMQRAKLRGLPSALSQLQCCTY